MEVGSTTRTTTTKKKKETNESYNYLAATSALVRDVFRLRLDINDMTLLWCCRCHLLLDLRSHGNESIFNIAGTLSRGLNEGNAQRIRKLLCGGSIDLPLVLEITLITDKKTINILASETINLTEPLLHTCKGLCVGDIIHDDDAVSATIVAASDGTETLLTSSIPL